MIPLRPEEIAAITGGTLRGPANTIVTGPIVIDSRAAVPGSMFVAIAGERVDGHAFVPDAVRAGAALVLTDRDVGDFPAVLVEDPVSALGRLAHGILGLLPAVKVVAITGSSGKTTTKDLIATLLERLGPTVSPPRSYNTEIGVPLTVLEADRRTAFLVLEMGARGAGHIRELTQIARPRVGVVLNIGTAHVGEFGSRDAIAKAKAELVEATPDDGLVVLNADDPRVAAMASMTVARVLTFGTSAGSDVRAEGITMHSGRPRFRLATPFGGSDVRLELVGRHQVWNALAAAAVALESGMTPGRIAEVLATAVPRSPWRMEVTDRSDGITVINDAYNANPESAAAAIDALVAIAGPRRTWAVLGEMCELGTEAAVEHRHLGALTAKAGISHVLAVGAAARPVADGASAESDWSGSARWVADADAASQILESELVPGDVVLVKASRAAGLENLALSLSGVIAG